MIRFYTGAPHGSFGPSSNRIWSEEVEALGARYVTSMLSGCDNASHALVIAPPSGASGDQPDAGSHGKEELKRKFKAHLIIYFHIVVDVCTADGKLLTKSR